MAAAALQVTCFSSLLALGAIALQDGTLLMQSGTSTVDDLAPARSGEEVMATTHERSQTQSSVPAVADRLAKADNDEDYYDYDYGYDDHDQDEDQFPTPEVVSGRGDPHLNNMRGDHFDVYQPGSMALLRVPRFAERSRAMLVVEADARRMAFQCSVYFQAVTISGMWTNESKPIQFLANPHGTPEGKKWKEWMHFGPIDLKVSRQNKGVEYLNVYARNVGHSGYEVGGLLGLDDHAAVSKRPRQCINRRTVALSSSALIDFKA